MCGGVVADISFGQDAVTWSNFRHANYLTQKAIGPFEFARSEYEGALRSSSPPPDE